MIFRQALCNLILPPWPGGQGLTVIADCVPQPRQQCPLYVVDVCIRSSSTYFWPFCKSCQASLLPILLEQLISPWLFCFLFNSLLARWLLYGSDWLVHIANHFLVVHNCQMDILLHMFPRWDSLSVPPFTPHQLIIYFPTRFSVKKTDLWCIIWLSLSIVSDYVRSTLNSPCLMRSTNCKHMTVLCKMDSVKRRISRVGFRIPSCPELYPVHVLRAWANTKVLTGWLLISLVLWMIRRSVLPCAQVVRL